jgi:hypothetical protein
VLSLLTQWKLVLYPCRDKLWKEVRGHAEHEGYFHKYVCPDASSQEASPRYGKGRVAAAILENPVAERQPNSLLVKEEHRGRDCP